VLCAIGPEWIGAGRRFEFWIDEEPIENGCTVHALRSRAIVERFELPASHETEATHGRAAIEQRGDTLWIAYEWSRAVPSQHAAAADFGEGAFELPEG
jgi:hypothetical protein